MNTSSARSQAGGGLELEFPSKCTSCTRRTVVTNKCGRTQLANVFQGASGSDSKRSADSLLEGNMGELATRTSEPTQPLLRDFRHSKHFGRRWMHRCQSGREFPQLCRLSEQSLANATNSERRTPQRDQNAPLGRKFSRAVRSFVPAELSGLRCTAGWGRRMVESGRGTVEASGRDAAAGDQPALDICCSTPGGDTALTASGPATARRVIHLRSQTRSPSGEMHLGRDGLTASLIDQSRSRGQAHQNTGRASDVK